MLHKRTASSHEHTMAAVLGADISPRVGITFKHKFVLAMVFELSSRNLESLK